MSGGGFLSKLPVTFRNKWRLWSALTPCPCLHFYSNLLNLLFYLIY